MNSKKRPSAVPCCPPAKNGADLRPVEGKRADEELASLAKATAHPARVQILRLLARRATCVCGEIVQELPLAQSTVSQHLKILKDAGLVRGTVDGPRVWGRASERHSSSGLITATGTGATGWARSIHQERASALRLPSPTSAELILFVREAWPSVATGTSLTEALVPAGLSVEVVSEMDDDGVIFGDGVEADRIEFSWGRRVTLRAAATKLRLLVG